MSSQQAWHCRARSQISGMWHPGTLTTSQRGGRTTPALCPGSAARPSLPCSRAQAPVLLQWCQALLPLSAALGLGSPAGGECEGVKGSLQAHNA